MIAWIRKRLGVKFFISYLLIIAVGTLVLGTAAQFAVPLAFNRHMGSMRMMEQEGMMGSGMMGGMQNDLFGNFRDAVNEALTLAALAALGTAIVVSALVSRRVVTPVREMMKASARIAEGNYQERVQVPGYPGKGELDELAQLALRFNQMAYKLEQTESMRRQLIGDVAHELRTPLTIIKGSMEGLIDGVLPPEESTYQEVYREADRLQRLVTDLQQLSRVEAGSEELKPRPVRVHALVEGTISKLKHQYREKNVALEVQLHSDLPAVFVEEDRIAQVLTNLLGNALQYTPPRGQVVVKGKHVGNEVYISVTDTGIGISAEHLPHLFTRFYRVDKSRSRAGGGSGVGLTISKHWVEAHGGRIWAESEGIGKGSTFTFTLQTS